jgi:putative acetyltransferase
MRVTHLRAATAGDRPFVERVYFETQRWLIEELFGWRGDDVERSKFDDFYDESHTAIVEIAGEPIGWLTVLRDVNNIELNSIYIAAQHQRQGIGTHLLRQLLSEADTAGKALTLSTATINPARKLYERLDFVSVHESKFKVYMVRAPENSAALIEIREEIPADISAIRAVHGAAFGRDNEARLVEKLREAQLIAASIVATDKGKVIGNAVFSRLSVHAPDKPISALALAPVAVTPDYQSRSIGSRIIRYGLAVCAQRDHAAVLVLGSPHYYSRFGFSPNLAQKVQSRYSKFGEHWMAVELQKSSLSAGPLEATYPAEFQEVE